MNVQTRVNLFYFQKMFFMGIIVSSAPALAEDSTRMQFSPDGYLSEKFGTTHEESQNSGIRVSEIDINGRFYTRYQHTEGTVLIEKLTRPDAEPAVFLECESKLSNPLVRKEQRIVLEKDLTQRISVDLALVMEIIVSQCDGRMHQMTPAKDPLEIGVKVKDDSGRTYRIFNRMLQPNLGIHTEF